MSLSCSSTQVWLTERGAEAGSREMLETRRTHVHPQLLLNGDIVTATPGVCIPSCERFQRDPSGHIFRFEVEYM